MPPPGLPGVTAGSNRLRVMDGGVSASATKNSEPVAGVLTELEDRLGILIEDDEVDAFAFDQADEPRVERRGLARSIGQLARKAGEPDGNDLRVGGRADVEQLRREVEPAADLLARLLAQDEQPPPRTFGP